MPRPTGKIAGSLVMLYNLFPRPTGTIAGSLARLYNLFPRPTGKIAGSLARLYNLFPRPTGTIAGTYLALNEKLSIFRRRTASSGTVRSDPSLRTKADVLPVSFLGFAVKRNI